MFKSLTLFLVFTHLVYAAAQACVGKQLLPVNGENFTILKRNVPTFTKWLFGVMSKSASLENNGKTVIIKLFYGNLRPNISEGPYGDDKYQLEFMYFNWLRKNYSTPDILPLELHVVFINNKYKSFQEAAKKNFGLTVWSFKYSSDFDPRPSELSADLFNAFKSIRDSNTKIYLANPSKILPTLFDMTNFSKRYYMYQGRLTSILHHCSGDVIWLEFPNTVKIGLEAFENIKNLLSFNNTPLMEQFHDSMPPNNPIYESVTDDVNYDINLFNETSVETVESRNGAEINLTKGFTLRVIMMLFVILIEIVL